MYSSSGKNAHKNQGILLFNEETKLPPTLTDTDVKDWRGSAEGEAWGKSGNSGMKSAWDPPPGHPQGCRAQALKAPVSTRTAPVPPLWAELCGKAQQSSSPRFATGHCISPSTSAPYGSSTYRSPQPSKRAWWALTGGSFVLLRGRSSLDSPPLPLEACPTYSPGSWGYLPSSHILAAAPRVWGTPVQDWVRCLWGRGRGRLPLPGLLTGALRPSSSESAPGTQKGLSCLFLS